MRGGGQDVLEYRHAAEGPRNLVGAGDAEAAAPRRIEARHVVTAECDRARRRGVRAGKDTQQGGLAGPVGSDDADRIAGPDAKINPVEHDERTELLLHGVGREKLVLWLHAWGTGRVFRQKAAASRPPAHSGRPRSR